MYSDVVSMILNDHVAMIAIVIVTSIRVGTKQDTDYYN